MGFRSPDGIGFDGKGNLFVTDNQGDWLGTSKMYHVEAGNFYGQVSSLVWKEGWDTDPLKMPVPVLDSMRTREAILFPHRSEEHTSELQSLMRISYAVFCLKKKNTPEYDFSFTENTTKILS